MKCPTNKHIQPPTGFTQDSFWYNMGSCENIKTVYNWYCTLEKYLTDPVGHVFGLLTGKYLNLIERCSLLVKPSQALLKEKPLVSSIILHSPWGCPAKGTKVCHLRRGRSLWRKGLLSFFCETMIHSIKNSSVRCFISTGKTN